MSEFIRSTDLTDAEKRWLTGMPADLPPLPARVSTRRYWRWWWKRLGVIGTLACLLSAGSTVLVGWWLCDFAVSQGQVTELAKADAFLAETDARLWSRIERLECSLYSPPGVRCDDPNTTPGVVDLGSVDTR